MNAQNTIAALLSVCILSLVWKENPAFRTAEHLMVGLAAAHSMVRAIDNYIRPTIKTDVLQKGDYMALVFMLFGAVMYFRHVPRIAWVARYPMCWFVGYGVGYTLAYGPRPFIKQITDTFIPLTSANNVIYFVVTLVTIAYFFFTPAWRDRLVGRQLDKWARWVMMIGFGATFGNVAQGRISLLLGRLQFLLRDWAGVMR